MRNYLEEAIVKRYLSLVEKEFSSITKITAAQCLDYIELIRASKNSDTDLFLIQFPKKGFYSLWLSIIIELNFFFEDQYYADAPNLSLNTNEKISIYGAICQYLGNSWEAPGCIRVKFSDNELNIDFERNKKHILKVPSSRILNKKKLYLNNKKEFNASRTPLSKILFQYSNDIIDETKLNSKILLVTGRGNTNEFRERFNDVILFDEKLSKIFKLDTNLIIKPDLEDYLNCFDTSYNTRAEQFFNWLKKLEKLTTIIDLKNKLVELSQFTVITAEFNSEFEEILFTFSNDEPKLKILKEKYPGVATYKSFDFKTVIINDIEAIQKYPTLISKFIQNKIPVIVLYERFALKQHEIQLQNNILSKITNTYSFIWTANKINSLAFDEDFNYIDKQDCQSTVSFLTKKITIKCTEYHPLDKLSIELISAIKSIDNFDCRRKCSNYLFAILFNLRCSNTKSDFIKQKITEFSKDAVYLRQVIDADIYDKIDAYLSALSEYSTNNKLIPSNNNAVYSFITSLQNQVYYTPSFSTRKKILNNDSPYILFPGFPHNEFRESPLLKSIFEYSYKKIEIICWPLEGKQTYEYLSSRISNGLMIENFPNKKNIATENFITNNSQIEIDLNSILEIKNFSYQENTQLNNLEFELNNIKLSNFSEYSISQDQLELEPKECNIIHFPDGKYLFHPKDGNALLIGVEGKKGGYEIKRIESKEIVPGYLYFDIDYSVGLLDLLLLSGQTKEEANELIEILQKWKNSLLAFHNLNGNNLDKTVQSLEDTKRNNAELLNLSNPTKSNLNYWLDDTEKLSLSMPNLKLIAKAVENTGINFSLEDAAITYSVRNKVRGKLNSLTAKIKKQLQTKLNQEKSSIKTNYNYTQDNVEIKVNVYTIVDITKDDGFFVEYSQTRKILC